MTAETLFTPTVPATDFEPQATRRNKVCHVSLTLSTGGLERLLVDFARHHDADRFEMEFATFGACGQPAHDIHAAGCEVFDLSDENHSRLAAVFQLARLFRERGVDVVHTHNAFPHVYGTLAARLAGVPVVVHTRHGLRFGHNAKEQLLFALASRLADRIVAVSDDTHQACCRIGRLDESKVVRIVNGVDLDRFSYHPPVNEPIAVSVGRLSAEKDFPTLLRATARVISRIPEFRLLLVGDGPEREALKQLASDLRLGDRVEFLGERRKVAALMSRAALFVSSSLTEGMSLTLLEAMAVGLPIVATDVGGNPETVEAGRTAVLVPPGDPESLADAIVELCANPARSAEMGRHGRERVERHFPVRCTVNGYEQLYDELLKLKRRERPRPNERVPVGTPQRG